MRLHRSQPLAGFGVFAQARFASASASRASNVKRSEDSHGRSNFGANLIFYVIVAISHLSYRKYGVYLMLHLAEAVIPGFPSTTPASKCCTTCAPDGTARRIGNGSIDLS